MSTPPSFPPAARGAPLAEPAPAPPRGGRRPLWIALAIVAAVVLVAAATAGGYALGRLRAAARQPAPGTVSAAFVQFRVAPGWKEAGRTTSEVELRSEPSGYMVVRSGSARQAGVTSDADLLVQALYGVTQNHLRGSVGSCLPLTHVDVGGKAGEEVGFLFREMGSDGTSASRTCQLVWVDVQGSRFYSWSASGPAGHLRQLVKATQAMQRTANWTS